MLRQTNNNMETGVKKLLLGRKIKKNLQKQARNYSIKRELFGFPKDFTVSAPINFGTIEVMKNPLVLSQFHFSCQSDLAIVMWNIKKLN